MYLNDAIKTIEMTLRSTCMMLEVVRNEQIDKAVFYDHLPLQDHFAQCVPPMTMYEDSSGEECLEYLGHFYKGLKEAREHEITAYRKGVMQEPNVVYIVDMLRGFIGHGFPDNYVACAKECYRVYERLKPKYRGIKSDKRRLEWQREVMTEIDKLCKKHKVKFTIDGEWTLSEGYLMDWLGRKYLEI
jgi:hypothetical protein